MTGCGRSRMVRAMSEKKKIIDEAFSASFVLWGIALSYLFPELLPLIATLAKLILLAVALFVLSLCSSMLWKWFMGLNAPSKRE